MSKTHPEADPGLHVHTDTPAHGYLNGSKQTLPSFGFETGSHCVTDRSQTCCVDQVGLNLSEILLPLSPECWD